MTPERAALAELPDLPRWIEARGLLLAGRGRVIVDDDGSRLVYSPADKLIVPLTVTVPPHIAELAAGTPGMTVVLQDIMLPSARWFLPDWVPAHVTLYTLPADRPLGWEPSPYATATLTKVQLAALTHLPPSLRDELIDAADRSPVWAALDGQEPVSFAYAAQTTESWFDVSVDTLEPWRARGFGRAAASSLISDLMSRKLQAVWGAVDGNEASRALAERLGFEPADELWVLTAPE